MPKARRKPQSRPVDDDILVPPETDSPTPERDLEPEVQPIRRTYRETVLPRPCIAEPAPDHLPRTRTPLGELSLVLRDTDVPTLPVRTGPLNISRKNVLTSPADHFTPPSEYGNTPDAYSISPRADSTAIDSDRSTPPDAIPMVIQSSSPKRSSLTQNQTALHSQLRYARPSSFASSRPASLVQQPPTSVYGSPSPTRYPLAYLQGVHDAGSGTSFKGYLAPSQPSSFSKFVKLPRSAGFQYGIATGRDRTLEVRAYNDGEIHVLGTLYNLPGTVVDAEILSWPAGPDYFPAVRPIIALTLFHIEALSDGTVFRTSSVQVYSLSKQDHLCELLRTPVRSPQARTPNLLPLRPDSSDLLRLRTSGKFLTVSSGASGEVFAFAFSSIDMRVTFDCLGKFWTTIQPRPKPRATSQTQTRVSNPDQATTLGEELVPVMALSGRWLAVCTPSSGSSQSINAALGASVRVNKHADVDLVSPGARPTPTCHVESPDVETVVTKIARTAAQGVVKGGQWIANTGVHAWNSYWKRDEGLADAASATQSSSHPVTEQHGLFPPTHADDSAPAKDPVVVAIYDLETLHRTKKHLVVPMAVFEPPKGCSFLSFAPHGLRLLSASRKGEYHYVWDLFEAKHVRQASAHLEDRSRVMANVRQAARYERLSGSIIMDVVWDVMSPARFALLTRNKTVHLYDLPASAARWPPARPSSVRQVPVPSFEDSSLDHNLSRPGGFLASMTSLASSTQTSLTSLRTRAPSMSGGISGIGAAGLGLAAATGTRGARAVGTSISRSFSAATGAVITARHVAETRMSIKNAKSVVAGRLAWTVHDGKACVCLLEEDSVRLYQVRTGRADVAQRTDVTVFETRNPTTMRVPSIVPSTAQARQTAETYGEWHGLAARRRATDASHPLSHAEIETTSPYTPFHYDHRVTLSAFIRPILDTDGRAQDPGKQKSASATGTWVFGDPVAMTKLDLGRRAQIDDNDDGGSVIIRDSNMSATITGDEEYIVSTARRKKVKRRPGGEEANGEEGFFEDGCDVLDFATDRV